MAYLAALPKGPNNYHPFKQRAKALERRNWVLSRMVENGYISAEEEKTYRPSPLGVTSEPPGARLFAAESFAEEVRRELMQLYGEDRLYNGGLSIRTTLDPKYQIMARQALSRGLLKFDRNRGYRGPVKKLDLAQDWGRALAKHAVCHRSPPWTLAVVLEVDDARSKGRAAAPRSDLTGKVVPSARPGHSPRASEMGTRRRSRAGSGPRSQPPPMS